MDVKQLEQMNIVIVGHVDHGKSTFIGRLLADTNSLPSGKLEQIRALCAQNSKPFEYAFLLDALKDEQSQGITIDSARCFFKTKKRNYIVIDAPGHIEFLKNMVTGAARAEAALLLIDAKEGVKENSRRHGFLLSMLGIKQVVVLVNKMDLIDYNAEKYAQIVAEYSQFLAEIKVTPKAFVPIAAFHGENITHRSEKMNWYEGPDVLTLIDAFEKEGEKEDKPLRLPVQDIYKFTEEGDDRRIIAGTIETGTLKVGDSVIFLPSQKTTQIKSIESFNTPQKTQAQAGEATGVTLETQIYIRPGELMCKTNEVQARTGYGFKANIFWLGKRPMILDKKYKLKLGATRQIVVLKQILKVLDASDLSSDTEKKQIERHDVGECIFQTTKPIAFDTISEIEGTGRFVIVDDYEISGGGIITEAIEDSKSQLEETQNKKEYLWERGKITSEMRATKWAQTPKVVLITGPEHSGKKDLCIALEETLFNTGKQAYYLGISNLLIGLGTDIEHRIEDRDEHIRRLGEIAHLFTDAGHIVISSISNLDDDEVKSIKALNHPKEILIITTGEHHLNQIKSDCELDSSLTVDAKIKKILDVFKQKQLIDYAI